MLKYVETLVTFSEFPDEISLCINISQCPFHCVGCHSPHLAMDIGEPLTEGVLLELINKNKGITCVGFMGGNPEEVNKLAALIKPIIKVGWYSGADHLSEKIDLSNFDYIKLGPYKEEFGPLTSRTTNQIMLEIDNSCGRPITKDITSKFWK